MGTKVYKQENFSRNRKRLQRADKSKIKRRLTNQKVRFRKYKAKKRDGLRVSLILLHCFCLILGAQRQIGRVV